MHILMYHEVVEGEPQEIHAVSVRQFAEQMRWLRQSGYKVVSLEDWLASRVGLGPVLPAKSIAITFDDGYRDNYDTAWPILLEYGFRATVFLTVALLGQTSRWREGSLALAPLLTWEQVREMQRQGIRFGSHTLTHADLTVLPYSAVKKELQESRQLIEQELGTPIRTFAYPSSRENARVRQLVQEIGYDLACTYQPGYVGAAGKDAYRLQRIGILATDTIDDFAQKVNGTVQRRVAWYVRLLRSRFGLWRRGWGTNSG